MPGGKTIVVIVLRADFYGRCSHYQEFGELLSTHHKLVGPMSLDEVRSAIERPATQQGAFFESG